MEGPARKREDNRSEATGGRPSKEGKERKVKRSAEECRRKAAEHGYCEEVEEVEE